MKDQKKKILLKMQKNEITEYYIYKKLAATIKDTSNTDLIKTA